MTIDAILNIYKNHYMFRPQGPSLGDTSPENVFLNCRYLVLLSTRPDFQ
jgi:hypothetical protein